MNLFTFAAMTPSTAKMFAIAAVLSLQLSFPNSAMASNQMRGFSIPMLHRDSAVNKTRAVEVMAISNEAVSVAPLYQLIPWSYLLMINVGSWGTEAYVYFDTAVSMIWLQCSDCRDSNPSYPGTYYSRNKSLSYQQVSCDHPLCRGSDQEVLAECMNGTCNFKVDSLDNNYRVEGILGSDRIAFSDIANFLFAANVTFGCATVDYSKYTSEYNSSGVIGLGLGRYSLPSQLSVKRFSYCLPSLVKNKYYSPPYMKFGDYAALLGNRTPFIPGYPKYYLKLEGISYGLRRLPIFDDQDQTQRPYPTDEGQFYTMSVESLTFPLMLPSRAYELLVKEFEQDNPLLRKSRLDSMETCYRGRMEDVADSATVTLHLNGGVDMQLSRNATFLVTSTSIDGQAEEHHVCLVVEKKVDGTAVLGLAPQHDHNIGFDLESEEISIFSMRCS